jgi:hypothetical protein
VGGVINAVLEEKGLPDGQRPKDPVPDWVHEACQDAVILNHAVCEHYGVSANAEAVVESVHWCGAEFRRGLSDQFKAGRVGFRGRQMVYGVLDAAMPQLLHAYMAHCVELVDPLWRVAEAQAKAIKRARVISIGLFLLGFGSGVAL